jgi:hypothetical protein
MIMDFMLYSNQWLTEFIGNNWMGLIILYGAAKAVFPNSKILGAIGSGFSNIFPVFRKKGE